MVPKSATAELERQIHTVLVVDDTEASRYSIQRSLRAAGFDVAECMSGAEALERARLGVSAVVLDVHLPDLHGFEVCRLLRADPATANLPIVHVSAIYVRTEDRAIGLSAGADAYYTSPVEPSVLTATIDALIRGRQAAKVLQDGESLFRGAFENAGCGLAIVDSKGRITEANAVMAALLQSTRQALMRRSIVGLVPKEYVAQVKETIEQWPVKPWRGRFPVISPSGGRITLEWSVTPHAVTGLSIAVVAPSSNAMDVRPQSPT